MNSRRAMSYIEIAGIRKVYQPTSADRVVAIDNVDLAIAKNEFVAIVGPSGCGKSTLLHMIGGFVAVERAKSALQRAADHADPGRTAAWCSSSSRCFPGRPCSATWNMA